MVREQPIIYYEHVADNMLIEVLVEWYNNFDLYWFHWPRDGDRLVALGQQIIGRTPEQDYEPIVILYDKDDNPCCVISRPHWEYDFSDLEDAKFVVPIEILFEGELHGSIVRSQSTENNFRLKFRNVTQSAYNTMAAIAGDIPYRFRTGEGHGLNIRGIIVDDPVDVANKYYKDFYS